MQTIGVETEAEKGHSQEDSPHPIPTLRGSTSGTCCPQPKVDATWVMEVSQETLPRARTASPFMRAGRGPVIHLQQSQLLMEAATEFP